MFSAMRRVNTICSTFSLNLPRFISSESAGIAAANLKITKTDTPKPILPNNKLIFGQSFSDHMLVVDWKAQDGWDKPKIIPYQNLSLDPSSTVFHYGVECFEGMKAYKDSAGKIRLFRPDMNVVANNTDVKVP
jgi:branched-chain amino acid aminotransferase